MLQPLRFFICLLAVAICAGSCKKKVEKVQENLLMELTVEGQWTITTFTKGSSDISADFSSYRFQFKRNNTVDAIKSNSVETTGTWDGSLVTKTIISNFPNPNPILQLLNGTWLVTDSGLTYVESTQTVSGEKRFLRIVKN